MKLSASELREFGERGYVIIRNAIPREALAAASAAIDRLVEDHPPPVGHFGEHFYWISALDADPWPGGGASIGVESKRAEPQESRISDETAAAARAAISALYHDTPLESLAESFVNPGTLEIAFNQAQVAMNYPGYSHRPGRGHVDGCQYGPDGRPGSFTLLAGVLMSEQSVENVGNLWVWPGTHRMHAEFFRERGPEALVASNHVPPIEIPEPVQVLGQPGDVVLAHYLLAHNSGGNYESSQVRRCVYVRLRRAGHSDRWQECVCDELLELDAVRAALS